MLDALLEDGQQQVVLHLRVCCVQVPLYTPQERAESRAAGVDDDPGMGPVRRLPLAVFVLEVGEVVREDRSALLRCIGELILVGDALVIPPGLSATLGIVSALPKDAGKCRVDMFIGEQSDTQPGHYRGWSAWSLASVAAFRAMSSSTRAGKSR